MLRVKTKIKQSLIPAAGLGLFADEFIPTGTIIWQYDINFDQSYTQEQYESIKNSFIKQFIETYSYKYNGRYILCVDDARFFNHSNNPNCFSTDYNETTLGYTKAKRDINKGEEMTDDYTLFGLNETDREFNTLGPELF